MPYDVMVDDNFHYQDSDSRWHAGTFATIEEALARCRQIVEVSLDESESAEGKGDAAKLLSHYQMFGDDPFIIARDAAEVRFSAWDYAQDRCDQRCAGAAGLTGGG
ncbi:MAG: hypothetical protein ABI696_08380 [Rubrivivax sp.]